jgi:hypothetical protein
MNDIDFEGYSGIHLNNTTFSDDILLLVVLLLLTTFSFLFRLNTRLFAGMINNIYTSRIRQNVFDTRQRDSFLFNCFMIFQTLLLSSIFIFLASVDDNLFIKPDITTTFLVIAGLFAALLAFYLLKKGIYAVGGSIFAEKKSYKMMFMNYQALFCVWGVFLYIPVLWILLTGNYSYVAYILFIISYLLFTIILIYRFVHIFFYKDTGLLFLSLYLCSQEIVPLVFLYEGLIYMYNIIETNNIWQ